jgi:hypothetical protein
MLMRFRTKAAALAAVLLAGCAGQATAPLGPVAPAVAPPVVAPPVAQAEPPVFMPEPATCDAPTFAAAARANAAGLKTSPWMFSAGSAAKPEGPGWEAYVPAVQHTLAIRCGADTGAFAQALSAWQAAHGLTPDGRMSRAAAQQLKADWQARRAHVARPCIALSHGQTDALPAGARYDNRDARLQRQTLAAYLSMLAAARAEQPELFMASKPLLAVSPWRDPAADRAACARTPGLCNGTAKTAGCSAHWSGRAIDINLGFAPGGDPTDSTYANRLFQSKTPLYAWLLDNAGRFGFVNYYYEPWHWEWQGDKMPG